MHRSVWLAIFVVRGATRFAPAAACVASASGCGIRADSSRPASDRDFLGAAQCATCHRAEFDAWQTSHHALAMQQARDSTVLGRFDSTRFAQGRVTSTFFRRDGRFVVNTQGADGQLHDFEIRYTFGVTPLQQYLVEFPGGRLQALSVAWDSRPASAGGQRWFSLDPGSGVDHTDEFHWTGRQQNWNYLCADCHSIGVRKRYDERTDEFHTVKAELNVACEGCHGPGKRHARWAAYPRALRGLLWRTNGLPAQLTERRGVRWSIDSAVGNAVRSTPRSTTHEIEICAQCHARRIHIADGYAAGAPFFDHYAPLLLEPGLYYPDGQQLDEVYEYGSFLQSKMYHAGVTCSDCHDPHSARLRHPGNGVCATCHRVARYDAPAHHFHAANSTGARCVSCHMPATTYMEIDPRRDHSFRIPRPDLTATLGVPNACDRCHADRDARWAAARIRGWYASPAPGFQRFAQAFAAHERGEPGAVDSLAAIAGDGSQPVMVRASAFARLAGGTTPPSLTAARTAAGHPHPLVRIGALRSLTNAATADLLSNAAPQLEDRARAVRQEAAWTIAPVAESLSTDAQRRAFGAAAAEFIASQRYSAGRAEHRLTLGTFYARIGELDSATAESRAALRLAPHMAQAYVNLAGLASLQGREPDAERTLREGLGAMPDEASLHHALGLSLARSGQLAAAIAELGRAAQLSPGDVQFAYVYAVALNRAGRGREAIRVLDAARPTSPYDRNVLYALAAFSRDAGDTTAARRYAQLLVQAHPADAQGRALLQSLGSRP
jgi:Flp pilus assembly protein TadD